MIENGHTISLKHREVYGFANGFMLPALRPGEVTITLSNGSSLSDGLGVVVSVATTFVLVLWIVVNTLRRRKDEDPAPRIDHESIVT
jgi:hypothetical protein